ncbi:Uncharacterised protein [Enterobacter cloacae]|nr:Uncharacterised protein [Enterobacter cloacae]
MLVELPLPVLLSPSWIFQFRLSSFSAVPLRPMFCVVPSLVLFRLYVAQVLCIQRSSGTETLSENWLSFVTSLPSSSLS